jgi:hypothetical protein
MGCAAANGSVDKPAKLACLKLPRGTCFFLFGRTFFNCPARFLGVFAASSPGDQKKHLPFHVRRHRSPALFIAVDGFDGHPQKLGHLFLGFVQVFPKFCKFIAIHKFLPLFDFSGISRILDAKCDTTWYSLSTKKWAGVFKNNMTGFRPEARRKETRAEQRSGKTQVKNDRNRPIALPEQRLPSATVYCREGAAVPSTMASKFVSFSRIFFEISMYFWLSS